jgi:hypothetical protein
LLFIVGLIIMAESPSLFDSLGSSCKGSEREEREREGRERREGERKRGSGRIGRERETLTHTHEQKSTRLEIRPCQST